jgi:WD40 repeat protein
MPDQWDAALVTLEGHRSSVNSVAFSPDGKRMASSSCDGAVKLWDSESGKLRTTLEGHSDSGKPVNLLKGHFRSSVNSVVFSPDDKRLASGSQNGTVKLWDTNSGQLWAMLTTCGGSVHGVAFSPDGKLLALGSSEVQLWDVESCKLLVTLRGHNGCVTSVAFSPDGRQLASGSYCGGVKLWYTESSKLQATLTGHSGYYPSYPIVTCVSFSPDGEQVASCSRNGSVKLWNSNSGELLATFTFTGLINDTTSLAFSPDGNKLLASDAYGFVLLDAKSGNLQRTHTVCSSSVNSIAFSRDGKLASGSHDYTVKLWDLESCEPWATPRGDNGDNGYFSPADSVAISSGSKWLASGSLDSAVKLWDARSGKLQVTIAAHKNETASAVAFSPDGKWLASGSHDNTIKLWDVKSGELRGTLASHNGHVYSVAFSLDGKQLASGSKDGTAKLWDVESHKLQITLRGHSEFVYAVAFSPNGERLATGSLDGTVKLWDFKSCKELQSLELGAAVSYLAFSADGSYLISNTGIIRPDPNMPTKPEQPVLFVSGDWVMLNSQRLLWLPKEYRANCFAVEGQNVVLGHSSGRVSYFRFECDKMNLDLPRLPLIL